MGISQTDLAEAVGKSRHWVSQLERGAWYRDGNPFTLEPDMAVKLAGVLDIPVVDMLVAGRVPELKWPDLSNYSSIDDNVIVIDVTRLTEHQRDIIQGLINEFKTLNAGEATE